MEDAEIAIVGYGIISRVVRSAIQALRKEGVKVGMLRPITLWPFPDQKIRELAASDQVRRFLVVEMSTGQMIKDVRLAVAGQKPVSFYGRVGGNIPAEAELITQVRRLMEE
jgi:pyruvate/2-oxoacid:ferredoxin oxidoreductase alpha subunit